MKCISCDKEVDRMSRLANLQGKENWDTFPMRDISLGTEGKTSMLGYGSLAKKLRSSHEIELPSV